MAGGGLLPPAYPNGHGTSPELKIAKSSVVFDTFLKSGFLNKKLVLHELNSERQLLVRRMIEN